MGVGLIDGGQRTVNTGQCSCQLREYLEMSDNGLPVDFSLFSLDGLHVLANGSDPTLRDGARRELSVRTGRAAGKAEYSVLSERSEFGNALPTARVQLSSGHARDVRAALYALAAVIERTLASTREGWTVTLSGDAVRIELMDGSAAEELRAMSLLRQAVDEVGSEAPRKTVRRGRATEQTAAVEPVASQSSLAADKARRRRRKKYMDAAGDQAEQFERELLASTIDLPVYALEDPKPAAYWQWLLDQWHERAA